LQLLARYAPRWLPCQQACWAPWQPWRLWHERC
jgi:hypothetical protein